MPYILTNILKKNSRGDDESIQISRPYFYEFYGPCLSTYRRGIYIR